MINICFSDDFLKQAIDDQSQIVLPATVKNIMDSWTHQSGFPVVTLNVSTGIVKQEPFYLEKVKNQTLLLPSWIFSEILRWLLYLILAPNKS